MKVPLIISAFGFNVNEIINDRQASVAWATLRWSVLHRSVEHPRLVGREKLPKDGAGSDS